MIFVLRGTGDILLMQSYLEHQDIDGHLLRLYIFYAGYLHQERHGTAIFFGAARASRTIRNVFVFYFLCFLFFSRSLVKKD